MPRKAVAIAIGAALAALISSSGMAQTEKINVYVELASTDKVGRELGRLLQARIRSSPGMALVANAGDSVVQLHLATLDPGLPQQGDQTAYSAVWTFGMGRMNQYYSSSRVGLCGARRLSACAADLTSQTAKEASAMRRAAATVSEDAK